MVTGAEEVLRAAFRRREIHTPKPGSPNTSRVTLSESGTSAAFTAVDALRKAGYTIVRRDDLATIRVALHDLMEDAK